jgi:hypothetical protein
MKVRELIEALQQEDPEREVIMASDGEGNNYSPLSDYWVGAYRAETTWYGAMGLEALTPEDMERGFADEDVIKDGVPALCLSPVC